MSLWVAVLIASLLSVAGTLAGYLVPESVMAGERTRRVTTLLPVALLAALVVVQSVTGDAGAIVVDARLVAVAAAVVLLLLAAFFYTVLSLALRYIVSMALRKEALGMGDVKLFFIMGFWLGIEWMPVLFIFAGVSGVFLALFWRIVIRKRDFPFGPPLIIALFSLLLLQGPILK